MPDYGGDLPIFFSHTLSHPLFTSVFQNHHCWEMSGRVWWQRVSVPEWAQALWEGWPDISSRVHHAEAFFQIKSRKSVGGDRNVPDKIKVPRNEWHSPIFKAEGGDRCSESSGGGVGDVCSIHSAKTPKTVLQSVQRYVERGNWIGF